MNGVDVVHSDGLVLEAQNLYWSKAKMAGNRAGHYVRTSMDVRSYMVSKSVDAVLHQPPRLAIMAEK